MEPQSSHVRAVPESADDARMAVALLRRLENLEAKIDRLQADHDRAKELLTGYTRKAKTVGALLKRVL
jgi:hypothetical protein